MSRTWTDLWEAEASRIITAESGSEQSIWEEVLDPVLRDLQHRDVEAKNDGNDDQDG